jgi:hypothetical protein
VRRDMHTACTLKRMIAGALLSGGLVSAGLGLSAGTAQAHPNPACNDMAPCETWCPGERLPRGAPGWDMSVCHDWYYGPGPGHQVTEGIPPPKPIPPLWVP